MLLTRQQVFDTLLAAGVPVARQNLFAPDEISGVTFGTVSADWVANVHQSAIAAAH